MFVWSLIPSLAVPKNPHKMVLKNNALLVLVYLSHLLLSSDSCEHEKLFEHFYQLKHEIVLQLSFYCYKYASMVKI